MWKPKTTLAWVWRISHNFSLYFLNVTVDRNDHSIEWHEWWKSDEKVQPGEVWNNRRKNRGVKADQGVARHGQLSHLKVIAAEKYLKIQHPTHNLDISFEWNIQISRSQTLTRSQGKMPKFRVYLGVLLGKGSEELVHLVPSQTRETQAQAFEAGETP